MGKGWGGGGDHPKALDPARVPGITIAPSPQFAEQRRDDSVGIAENLVIPEADDREPLVLEPRRARGVGPGAKSVLSAVELDNEATLETDEIDDIASDGRLAAKPTAVELPPAQARPQPALGLGRLFAQGARPLCRSPGHGPSIPFALMHIPSLAAPREEAGDKPAARRRPPSLSLPHAGGGNAVATAETLSHARGGDAVATAETLPHAGGGDVVAAAWPLLPPP